MNQFSIGAGGLFTIEKVKLSKAATMFVTGSVRRSAEFYRARLGFEIDSIHEPGIANRPDYSVVKRKGLETHFESYELMASKTRGRGWVGVCFHDR